MTDDGQQLLATSFGSAAVAAPGSGSTIVLWSSAGNISQATQGARYKRLIININSSAASAANGLQVDESEDGTNWDNLVSFSIAANTRTKNFVVVGAPFVRVRYVNSANVLSTWRMSVLGDQNERGTQ